MNTWNERVAKLRTEKGLGKSALARACGVAASTVNDWENGDIKELTAPKLLILSEVLDADPWYILNGKERPKTGRISQGNTNLTKEAESLISLIERMDSNAEITTKTFILHTGLLQLSVASLESQTGSAHTYMAAEADRLLSALLDKTGTNYDRGHK